MKLKTPEQLQEILLKILSDGATIQGRQHLWQLQAESEAIGYLKGLEEGKKSMNPKS